MYLYVLNIVKSACNEISIGTKLLFISCSLTIFIELQSLLILLIENKNKKSTMCFLHSDRQTCNTILYYQNEFIFNDTSSFNNLFKLN